MQANPLWPVTHRFPALEKDTRSDIVIIGAGITGISGAYFLRKAGYDVIVLEEDEIGSKATGASSGILYYGSGTNYAEAQQLYGATNAKLLWNETRETIQQITHLIEKHKLSCGLRKTGAIMAAESEEDIAYLKEEARLLNDIPHKILGSEQIAEYYKGRPFPVGLYFPEVAQIHPAHFAASLAHEFSIPVFEHTQFLSYDNKEKRVKTPNASITCDKVVCAANLQPLFGLEKYYREESSAIVAGTPTGTRSLWPRDSIIWTVGDRYDILYPHDNRYILEVFSLKGIKDKIQKYYPGFTKDKQWGDSWAKTEDALPIVGLIQPDIFAAVAMGDQGIVMGFTIARKITSVIEEKQDRIIDMCSIKRFQDKLKVELP